MNRLCLAAVTALLLILPEAAFTQSVIRLLRSDRAVTRTVRGNTIHRVIGSVHWYIPERDVNIYCDTTDIFREEQEYILLGNVKIIRPDEILESNKVIYKQEIEEAYSPGNFVITRLENKSELTAETGTYYYEQGKIIAEKNAVYRDSSRILYADRLEYLEEEEFGIGDGNVRIVDLSQDGIATGSHVEYFGKSDSGLLTGSPRIAIADSAGTDSLFVTGIIMEYFGGDSSKFIVTDSVNIRKENLKANSRTATYDKLSSTIFLRDNPRIEQDSTEIFGVAIDLKIENETVSEVIVIDSAVALSPADSTGRYDLKNLLSGNVIRIFLEDNLIRKITASKNAVSEYYAFSNNELEGKHFLSAEQIILEFKDGKLDRLLSDMDKHKFIPKSLLKEVIK